MSKDKKPRDVVRPHVADGIEEYDNPMPSWWLGLFYVTIVFGVTYLIWYHVLGKPGLMAELNLQRAAYQSQQEMLAASTGASGNLVERLKDPDLIHEGHEIYSVNCVPCHGAEGEGGIGPNLTDRYWLHGGTPEAMITVVTKGVPEKGMVSWESSLGPKKIEAVVAYVRSLQGTTPHHPKAPQGEEYKD